MSNNLYWAVYKNLEREIIELSNLIHFDDKQLEFYSIKISELLIRTVVEVESIVKELYFKYGGTKSDDKDLYFDTDCIELLENKWKLSKKQILISASNFYFIKDENKILMPLNNITERYRNCLMWSSWRKSMKEEIFKCESKSFQHTFTTT